MQQYAFYPGMYHLYNDDIRRGANNQVQTGRLLRMRGYPVGRGDQNSKVSGEGGDGRQEELLSGHGNSSRPDWGWGATVDLRNTSKTGDPAKYEVTVLVMCKPDDSAHGRRQQDAPPTPMVSGVSCGRPCVWVKGTSVYHAENLGVFFMGHEV